MKQINAPVSMLFFYSRWMVRNFGPLAASHWQNRVSYYYFFLFLTKEKLLSTFKN